MNSKKRPETLHELVSFVEHVDHKLFEVGFVPRVVRVFVVAAILAYRRHHVAHHFGGGGWVVF